MLQHSIQNKKPQATVNDAPEQSVCVADPVGHTDIRQMALSSVYIGVSVEAWFVFLCVCMIQCARANERSLLLRQSALDLYWDVN